MGFRLAALALLGALGCAAEAAQDPELVEGELLVGRLDADGQFSPSPVDPADGRVQLEVELGFQGAWMVVLVVAVPPAQIGRRVDFGCQIETEGWASAGGLLQGVLVHDDGLLHAPFVILNWWDEEPTSAALRCEVRGSARWDLTTLDARLIPASPDEAGP